MHLNLYRAFAITVTILALIVIFAGITMVIAKYNTPEIPKKPAGMVALEKDENRSVSSLLNEIRPVSVNQDIETIPPIDPNAPIPAGTYLYNNLPDNLLSSLHYFFITSEDTEPSAFVISWDAETGARVLGNSRLFSIQYNTSYLLTLEIYKKMHSKAIFDDDLEYARNRVDRLFGEDWHTIVEWPAETYFDLTELYEITGDEKYLRYADKYAAGQGANDPNTPLLQSKDIAIRQQFNRSRSASPFYFYNAALLADWGKRNDPSLINPARFAFEGIRKMLYDSRYTMFRKQASTQKDGSTNFNIIDTFDTLEQLSAVCGIAQYAKASGDPEAFGLAKQVLAAMWNPESPLLIKPPEDAPEATFYGLYTAYDHTREATRYNEGEITIDQIMLFDAVVTINRLSRGDLRGDVDFLTAWLEDGGPLYRKHYNGYFVSYGKNWADPESKLISSKAAIRMARALVHDEWYKFKTAEEISAIEP